jgi:hypothetical protein
VNKTLDIHLDDETRPWLRLSTNYLQRTTTTDIPPVLFMHIPKTAGTSFNSFMRTHLPFNVMACHIEKYASDSFAALSRSKKYLAGHLTIEKFKNHFPISGFDCYSIVRSPYNHLHSHLNWLKGIATHSDSQFFKQHNTAVQQLAVKVSKVDFNNLLQVKKFVFGLRGFELYFFDNCQTRYFLDYCPQKVSRNDFQNTLENIDLFKYVGLTEEYDQFKEFVASTYRLPRVSLPEKINRMTGPRLYDPESKEIQEVLFPLVHTDMLLYGYISNHFSSSCRGSYLQ